MSDENATAPAMGQAEAQDAPSSEAGQELKIEQSSIPPTNEEGQAQPPSDGAKDSSDAIPLKSYNELRKKLTEQGTELNKLKALQEKYAKIEQAFAPPKEDQFAGLSEKEREIAMQSSELQKRIEGVEEYQRQLHNEAELDKLISRVGSENIEKHAGNMEKLILQHPELSYENAFKICAYDEQIGSAKKEGRDEAYHSLEPKRIASSTGTSSTANAKGVPANVSAYEKLSQFFEEAKEEAGETE